MEELKTPQTATPYVTILQVTTSIDTETGCYCTYSLSLDRRALFNLKSYGASILAAPKDDLPEALICIGAMLNNMRHMDGHLIPAVQMINGETGYPAAHVFCKNNSVQDPMPNLPAMQIFNARGQVITRYHYDANQLHDPRSDEPAVQYIDPEKEVIIDAESYTHGVKICDLDMKALVQLNRAKRDESRAIDRLVLAYSLPNVRVL